MSKLKRELGLLELSFYGVGVILGAGIYAIIGEASMVAGNALWMSFLIGAVIALFTAFSYAELGSLFPKEAAEFVFARKAFGKNVIPFLLGWLMAFVSVIASAAVALGFGGYLESITGISQIVGAGVLIAAVSLVNFWGMRESSITNIIFTSIEAAGLLFIIYIGLGSIGSVNYFEMPSGFTGVIGGAILVFFAYLGFEDIVNVSEEVKNPKKTVPTALMISVVLTTVIYVLVSLSSISLVNWETLGSSSAPLADVAEAGWAGSSFMFSIVALFATGNTVLILMIVASRVLSGMARARSLPRPLARIHKTRGTPWFAILVSALLALGFIFMGDLRTVAEVTNFGAFVLFSGVNLSLIVLRYKYPNLKRGFMSPVNVGKFPVLAALGLLSSVFMLFNFGASSALIGLVLLGIGVIMFYYWCDPKTGICRV